MSFPFFQFGIMNNARRSKPNQVYYHCSEPKKFLEVILKTKLMEDMGIRTLPVIDDAGPFLNSNNFPNYPFVNRGPEANTICCLKSDVSRAWNLGDVDTEEFYPVKVQRGILKVLTANLLYLSLPEQSPSHCQKPRSIFL